MLGLFRKRDIPAATIAAFDMSRRSAAAMMQELSDVLRERFMRLHVAQLEALEATLARAARQADVPALVRARSDFKFFVGQVEALRPKMADEARAQMGWMASAEDAETRALEAMVQQRIDTYVTNLSIAGYELLGDHAVALRDADAAWRKAHPEKSAEYPAAE